jgi:hypothetical protein
MQIDSPAARRTFTEFGQLISHLKSLGKEVVVISCGPSSEEFDPGGSSPRGFQSTVPRQLRFSRTDFESFIRPVKTALFDVAVSNGARVIDPLDYFEEDGFLNGITPDGHFRYKDAHHFRPFYVREKAVFLDALLQAKR